jgi:hypothetical protein
MIDPRLDVLVWGAMLLLFLLMGARAWAVETAEAGQYRKSARVRVLNGATAVAFVALLGLMAMQGGVVLVQAIATRTEPNTFVTVVGDDDDGKDRAVRDPDDQPAAPADPNAPPAGGNAPPAGANPPAAPAAPDANPGGAPAGGAPAGGARGGGAPAGQPARPGG